MALLGQRGSSRVGVGDTLIERGRLDVESVQRGLVRALELSQFSVQLFALLLVLTAEFADLLSVLAVQRVAVDHEVRFERFEHQVEDGIERAALRRGESRRGEYPDSGDYPDRPDRAHREATHTSDVGGDRDDREERGLGEHQDVGRAGAHRSDGRVWPEGFAPATVSGTRV